MSRADAPQQRAAIIEPFAPEPGVRVAHAVALGPSRWLLRHETSVEAVGRVVVAERVAEERRADDLDARLSPCR